MCHRFAAFPDSVAEKRPWRLGGDVRETAMLHSLSSPRSGRMHHSEAYLQKRARPLGTQLSGDIQQHAMARTPLDSIISSRYKSSIEHAFVFIGRPKLLAAETA